MVPQMFHYLLVKETLQLIEVRCRKCGRRRILPRRTNLEKVTCRRCGREIFLKSVEVR